MMRRTHLSLALLTCVLPAVLLCQKAARELAPQDILNRAGQTFDGVQDFEVSIAAEIDMERVRAPRSEARLYFKKPDKVRLVSSSFAMIPRDGIGLNPEVLRERYDALNAVVVVLDGRALYKLQLVAKDSKTRLRELSVWIDPSSWTVARTETIPYEGRTLTIDVEYGLQQGKFWLPLRMQAKFGSADTAQQRPAGDLSGGPPTPMDEARNLPRRGTITMTYSDYKVNMGIPDDFFERKDAKQ